MLDGEFHRTRRMILASRTRTNYWTKNASSRSIRLRNPYVDPMSLIQVELLAASAPADTRYAESPAGATINGIAAGLHNTG